MINVSSKQTTYNSSYSHSLRNQTNEHIPVINNRDDARCNAIETFTKCPPNQNDVISKAKENTTKRLDLSRSKRETERLNRRLVNLEALEKWMKHNNATLQGFLGWGDGAHGATSGNGISQYDTAYISVDGHLQAYQLDSSWEVQQWGDAFTRSNGLDFEQNFLHLDEINKLGPPKVMYNNQLYQKHVDKAPTVINNVEQSRDQLTSNLAWLTTSAGSKSNHRKNLDTKHSNDETDCLHHHHHHYEKGLNQNEYGSTLQPLISKPSSEKLTESGVQFKVVETKHGNHSHFSLGQVIASESKPKINADEEGCPCCVAGVDLDEIAAAVVKMANPGVSGEEAIHSVAHFDEVSHWGVALGVAAPFALIGLTAAYRNIKGCWSNRQKIKVVIKGVEEDIQRAKKWLGENSQNDIIKRLEAFKDTLSYSKMDAEFNLLVPGIINGAASSFVLASLVWHNPFALPVIGGYAVGQLGRNSYDLVRVWNHHVPDKKDKTYLTGAGINKVNQIASSKRTFYASNAFGFALFAAGGVVTFLSLPALALGVGAATMLVGLSLLGAGALSTGILNNIWPIKFKPRNGDLGIDRKTLSEGRCLTEIGERRALKTILKKSRDKWIKPNKLKRFGYKFLTALPFGANKGEKCIHQYNLSLFNANSHEFEDNRKKLLDKLLLRKGVTSYESNWDGCKKLGIQNDVVNVLIKDFLTEVSTKSNCKGHHHGHNHGHHHGHHHGHNHDHNHGHHDHSHLHTDHSHEPHGDHNNHGCSDSKETYINDMIQTGLFKRTGETISLDATNFEETQHKILNKAIDFYLHFGFIEKLRYQQYGLNDFFWALKKSGRKKT